MNACIHVIRIYVTPRMACWQVSRQNTQKSECVLKIFCVNPKVIRIAICGFVSWYVSRHFGITIIDASVNLYTPSIDPQEPPLNRTWTRIWIYCRIHWTGNRRGPITRSPSSLWPLDPHTQKLRCFCNITGHFLSLIVFLIVKNERGVCVEQ